MQTNTTSVYAAVSARIEGAAASRDIAGAGSRLAIVSPNDFFYSSLCLSIRGLRGVKSTQRADGSLASDIAQEGIAFTYAHF